MPVRHVRIQDQGTIALAKAQAAERGIKDNDERSMAIVSKIRVQYSIQAEAAILRKAIHKLALGQQPDEEYFTYYDFVEQCKAEVDEEASRREEL